MSAVAPTYLSGYFGSITVDSVALPYSNGRVARSTASFDATNALTGGAAFPERAVTSCKGTIEIFVVAAGTSPTILSGSVYAATFYRKSTKGYACNIYIDSLDEVFDQKGGSVITVTFSSQGAITDS